MRLVLVFVALLLSLPLSPQARPKGYELDYYRVRLESVETDGAWGGVIGNPENEQGFTSPATGIPRSASFSPSSRRMSIFP